MNFFGRNVVIHFWCKPKSVKSSLSTLDIPKPEKINSLNTGTNIKPGQKFSFSCMVKLSLLMAVVCLVMTSLTEPVDNISATNTSATALVFVQV